MFATESSPSLDALVDGPHRDLGVIGDLDLDQFADGTPLIPRNLDLMEAGPVLAALLSSIDSHSLNGYDRIVVLRARQRMASHYAGKVMDDMLAVADVVEEDWDSDPEGAAHAATAEIRAALRLTRRAAGTELETAVDLKSRLPRVWEALIAGDIDPRRARTIAHRTIHLDDDICESVVDRIIEDASNLTTGEIAAKIRKLAVAAAPDESKRRYEHAVEQRRVVAEPTLDGTSVLTGYDMPPDRVAGAMEYINRLAKQLGGPLETRSIDQLRADVMLDLLNGIAIDGVGPSRSKGVVDIRVDLTTLAGLNDDPAELAGFGPVIADIARRVAKDQPNATWQYCVTDPDTGRPLFTGVTRRRPTASMARWVQALRPRCVFPGCRMPARQSDIDHRIEYAKGGRTAAYNLAPLCRYDHGIRHGADWKYTIEADGTITWRSRLGHTYQTGTDPP